MLLFSLLSILGLLSVLIFSNNANADDRYRHRPPIRPMHPITHHNFQYVYYPAQQAYYAPHTKLWYWNAGNRWQSAYNAPAYLNINLRVAGIPIQLGSALPYQEHAFVTRQYGSAWNNYRGPQYRYVNERNYRRYDSNRHYDRHERHDRNDRNDRHDRHDRNDRHRRDD